MQNFKIIPNKTKGKIHRFFRIICDKKHIISELGYMEYKLLN